MKRKKTNKFIVMLGLILILVSILITCFEVYKKYQSNKETEHIIETIFQEEVPTPEVVEEVSDPVPEETPKKQDIVLTNKYLGYIEFSNYGVKRLITTGTDKATLDKGLVGTLNVSAGIDDKVGNLIIAGHSVSNTFQKLHYMKIGEEIKIVSHKDTYIYKITEKHTINDNDMSYFKKIDDKKILTLITCKNNGNQRLIVIAELRG